MKKSVLILIAMLALLAGGNSLLAQWAQYNADVLPDAHASGLITQDEVNLLTGTNEIVVDPGNAENKLWKIDVNLDGAEILKYNWYPSYWDVSGGTSVPDPKPSTIAWKFQWIDTAGYSFGPEAEVREVYKVQVKMMNDKGLKIKVKDWTLDSSYALPEGFDATEWHVLRLTLNSGAWNVYLDENPVAFASGMAGKQVDKHIAIIGAYAEAGKCGGYVDWMGYLEAAASSPTEMPLPAGVFDPATAVRNVTSSDGISVYPNPASEYLTISLNSDPGNSRYELISITGQLISEGMLKARTQTIDVSGFNAGMYFVRVISSEGIASGSFIVK